MKYLMPVGKLVQSLASRYFWFPPVVLEAPPVLVVPPVPFPFPPPVLPPVVPPSTHEMMPPTTSSAV